MWTEYIKLKNNHKTRLVESSLLLLICAPILASQGLAQVNPKDVAADLRNIQECKTILSTPRVQPPVGRLREGGKPYESGYATRRCESQMNGLYKRYNYLITSWSMGIFLLEAFEPAKLEATYKEWKNDRRLDALHELIRSGRLMATNKICRYECGTFSTNIYRVLQSTEVLEKKALDSTDLNPLYVAYWRLLFIEPYSYTGGSKDYLLTSSDDIKTRISRIENRIKESQVILAEKMEIESIKTALKDTIDTGKLNAELEERISALPDAQRTSIEAFRKDLLDEKKTELAKAQEEKERREKMLARQLEIEQAIKWRQGEIETGKPNSAAQKQRQGDPEIRKAVELWEIEHKKEKAEKRADEAKQKLAAMERAKEGERKRKEAQEVRRKEAEEEARLQAKLRTYNVQGTIMADSLYANPYQYQGRSVILRGARFERMLERNAGIFQTFEGHEILIVQLPTQLFSHQGQMSDLIVRVKGTGEVANALGIVFKIPKAEYLDVFP